MGIIMGIKVSKHIVRTYFPVLPSPVCTSSAMKRTWKTKKMVHLVLYLRLTAFQKYCQKTFYNNNSNNNNKCLMKMKKWSSQWTQFMQLCKEAWKKFRTSTGFEPVTSRYRCDALPTELWSHWRWEQVNCGFICSRERNEC